MKNLLRIGAACMAAALTVALPHASAAESTSTIQQVGLKPLSADRIAPLAKPAPGQSVIDPAYGTRIHRATNISDGEGGRMRHEYSRRQAFNADNSRYLVQDGRGAWYLYNAATFTKIEKLEGFAGDCEAIWHPSDPNKIYLTERDGGTTWWSYDIATHRKDVLFDFKGKTPWPKATSFWTKSEGTTSADGRYLGLMATNYDETTQKNTIYGLVTVDLKEKKIVGTLDAKNFPMPNAFPDHISTSPSGKYVVPSWLDEQQGGTRAYSRDFSTSVELAPRSEHSDLAFGPNKEDYYVYADYLNGQLAAVNLDTKQRINLDTLYPAPGEAYSLHVSGQAFAKPGWAVISTYGDNANYNTTWPAPELRPQYRKVWLVELKPGGRKLNVAHVRSDESKVSGDDAYFLEPHASASRDLSCIIYASNFGGRDVESYVVEVPANFAN
ncbi:MAG: hypothetical protein Q4A82_03090 [Corynebacterium sp.]|nr:hypothetical protein [Corynebacterium sp.]